MFNQSLLCIKESVIYAYLIKFLMKHFHLLRSIYFSKNLECDSQLNASGGGQISISNDAFKKYNTSLNYIKSIFFPSEEEKTKS